MKVLIIEDDFIIRELIKDITINFTSRFFEAQTYSDAKKLLTSNLEFDFIILDNILPDGFGIYLAYYALKKSSNTFVVSSDAYNPCFVKIAKSLGIKNIVSKTNLYPFLIDNVSRIHKQKYQKT